MPRGRDGDGARGGPTLGMIWAQARGGVIGAEGGMPWHLPEDLAHFKAATAGRTVIMGRATWDSLPPRFRPLPGRRNIVVTRDLHWESDGAVVVHSVGDALAEAERAHPGSAARTGTDGGTATDPPSADAWVTGGAQIYAALLPYAELCVITDIDADVAGDTVAPALDAQWAEAAVGAWRTSERSGLRYRFRTMRRRTRPRGGHDDAPTGPPRSDDPHR